MHIQISIILKTDSVFAAAIILTPIICALENKLHPIIMDKIYEEEHRIEAKSIQNQNC